MNRKTVLAPSILSADFSDIRSALNDVETSDLQWVHLDVMDGVFVPNITFGPKFIADMRPLSKLVFDTHLMIVEPWKYIEKFAKAGSDAITVHYEACCDNLLPVLKLISDNGCKAGISIRPETPVDVLNGVLDFLDIVLIMSVNPGFGGQSFIPQTMGKVKKLAEIQKDYHYLISVDGGINQQTAPLAIDAGADILVTGSAFFGSENKPLFVRQMLGNK